MQSIELVGPPSEVSSSSGRPFLDRTDLVWTSSVAVSGLLLNTWFEYTKPGGWPVVGRNVKQGLIGGISGALRDYKHDFSKSIDERTF